MVCGCCNPFGQLSSFAWPESFSRPYHRLYGSVVDGLCNKNLGFTCVKQQPAFFHFTVIYQQRCIFGQMLPDVIKVVVFYLIRFPVEYQKPGVVSGNGRLLSDPFFWQVVVEIFELV